MPGMSGNNSPMAIGTETTLYASAQTKFIGACGGAHCGGAHCRPQPGATALGSRWGRGGVAQAFGAGPGCRGAAPGLVRVVGGRAGAGGLVRVVGAAARRGAGLVRVCGECRG